MMRNINIVIVSLRFIILLCHQPFLSCSDEIKINFKCSKDSIYYKCVARDLNITLSHKNATFVMGKTEEDLTEVVFESSTMTFIPPAIFEKSPNIREFIAKNVSIEEIFPETFNDAHNLHYLIMPFNRITQLADDSFKNASSLQTLKLQNNQIETLGTRAFFGLSELRLVFLSFNKIAYLPLFLFSSLVSLTDLKLDHNVISVISSTQFENNLGLSHLNFEFNTIVTIDAGTFSNLTALEILDLRKNKCVDTNFYRWYAENQTELYCCTRPIDEVEKCMELKSNSGFISNHWVLILLLFLALFGNFFAIGYYLSLRRNRRIYAGEDIELFAEQNGSVPNVY